MIAESNDTILVENNHYFPPESVKQAFLEKSSTTSTCPWKGEAAYYHIHVDGEINHDAAWYYPNPKDAAKKIKNYIAFWKGVKITG
ncbi:MAG: DUF427 domain-containing protein [FCB group bacterium]|nr:DUF427 domain-containing protein [FCB group bacterium]